MNKEAIEKDNINMAEVYSFLATAFNPAHLSILRWKTALNS